MTNYYPDQRYASNLTIIRRECMLPEEALGQVKLSEGKRVDVRDVVASGAMPSQHLIIDALAFFGLKDPKELLPYMQVEPGDVVDERGLLAGKNPKRGRRLFSPVRAIVMRVDSGRFILQQLPPVIELEAGVRGKISSVIPGRGVVIEAVGAQVQGVWGNNKRTIATLRQEPQEGITFFVENELDMRFVGAVLLTTQPLTQAIIDVMSERGINGVIAPSADVGLRGAMLAARGAILLTEGFGSARMSVAMTRLLAVYDGQQVTVDAHQPSRWDTRRPEVIINIAPRGDERPARPNPMLALRPGMAVRVTRDPFAGQMGKVVEIPRSPVLLSNGLRVLSAQVELVVGEVAYIPLANLEVLGR